MTIEIANRLLEQRKKHNLSQEELAEKLGVSRQAISKWERNEANPDTDNLIALAKIYGISLDELVFGAQQEANANEPNESKGENSAENASKDEESENNKGENKVKIDPNGIFIESEDGDRVKIDSRGIFVESEDGEKVKINLSGISVDLDDEDFEIDDDEDVFIEEKSKLRFWYILPYPVICTIAYLTFGFMDILGGWAKSWIVFITIPIYYSLIDAISKKRFDNFAYPVFTAFIYLFMGLYLKNWHPSWLIFVTIPAYYSIVNHIDKKIEYKARKKNKAKNDKNNIVL